ncbi:sensor histidine kinase [Pseudarthrobacter sp. J1738]|uniref:sensor histidine kinase n=1 Tax=Pseudarthrobacter sp. J1738 TaxID=3420446 RepID=UPI003D2C32A2
MRSLFNRRWGGLVLALVLPATVELAVSAANYRNFNIVMLLHLAAAVTVAAIGGVWAAVVASILGFLLLNYFSAVPVHTFSIADPSTLFTLVMFLAVACSMAVAVGTARRRAIQAQAASKEAHSLSELALQILASGGTLSAFLDRVRDALNVPAITLLKQLNTGEGHWKVLASSGENPPMTHASADSTAVVDSQYTLLLRGTAPGPAQQRLLNAFGAYLVAIRERRELVQTQQDNARLEEGNSMRTAILRAVSHDLRTPLSGIKLAVSSLRQPGVELPAEDRSELLETIEDYADRLDHLVGNLLDMSRLSADSATPLLAPVMWADSLPEAMRGLDTSTIHIELSPAATPVLADIGMLERVVANLLENAFKYAPGQAIEIRDVAGRSAEGSPAAQLIIADHGTGVDPEKLHVMFRPFQRLDDGAAHGLGLGLAVAKGLSEAMGGTLGAEPTPGGGLTVTLTLPLYEPPVQNLDAEASE